MRIAFLTRSLNYGGAERQLVTLARGLAARGHEVHVGVFYSGGPLGAELRDCPVWLHELGKRGRWDVAGFLARTRRFLRRVEPEVLHGYLVAPNLVSLLLARRRRGVRVVWGVRASDMDLDRYDWLARATFGLSRRLAGRADLIIANSEAGLRFHAERGFPRDRMVCIPNGIDATRFRPDRKAGRICRAEWNVGPGASLIGHVGRLDPMKDHPTFLEAAARLARERGDVRFVCVGEGPPAYTAELKARARELELGSRLIWAGSRDDMPAVFNALDLLTSSSCFGEGFPNVVAEAMACGVPCVVTDVGDSARVVGDLGTVVPPGEPDRLVDGWRELLDREPPPSAAALHRRIAQEFSIDALVERTERQLRALRGER